MRKHLHLRTVLWRGHNSGTGGSRGHFRNRSNNHGNEAGSCRPVHRWRSGPCHRGRRCRAPSTYAVSSLTNTNSLYSPSKRLSSFIVNTKSPCLYFQVPRTSSLSYGPFPVNQIQNNVPRNPTSTSIFFPSLTSHQDCSSAFLLLQSRTISGSSLAHIASVLYGYSPRAYEIHPLIIVAILTKMPPV